MVGSTSTEPTYEEVGPNHIRIVFGHERNSTAPVSRVSGSYYVTPSYIIRTENYANTDSNYYPNEAEEPPKKPQPNVTLIRPKSFRVPERQVSKPLTLKFCPPSLPTPMRKAAPRWHRKVRRAVKNLFRN